MALTPDRGEPLNAQILERLQQRLRAEGARPLEGRGPGLTSDEIGGLSQGLPAPLPAELGLWWSWRTWGAGELLPNHEFWPLESSINERASRLEFVAEELPSPQSPGLMPDYMWHPLWLPVFAHAAGSVVAADLATSNGKVAALRLVDWHEVGEEEGFARVVAPCLGVYLTHLLDELDAGQYLFDSNAKAWYPA